MKMPVPEWRSLSAVHFRPRISESRFFASKRFLSKPLVTVGYSAASNEDSGAVALSGHLSRFPRDRFESHSHVFVESVGPRPMECSGPESSTTRYVHSLPLINISYITWPEPSLTPHDYRAGGNDKILR